MTIEPVAENPALPAPFAVSRRTMLRGLGIGGLSAVLARLLGQGPALAAPPDRTGSGGPTTAKKRLGAGTVTQPTPYTVTASTELSEEVFKTSEVPIKSGDYIYPFVNPKNGNQVEAVVLSRGALNHLRRDATSPTGWSYASADLHGAFTSVNDVAVAANDTNVYLLVFGTPNLENNDGEPALFTWLDDAMNWDYGILSSYQDLGIDGTAEQGVVKGGTSREGVPYFSTVFVDGNTTTLGGWIATGNLEVEPLVYQQYLQLDTSGTTVEDFIILYDTGISDADNPTGFAFVLMSDEAKTLMVYPQDGQTFGKDAMTDVGTSGVTELMWAWYPPDATTGTPGYAYQTTTGTGFVDENGHPNTVADVALSNATNAVAVWQLNGLYTVNLLDSNGTLQMIQELSSANKGTWAPLIPLVPDLQAVYGVPTDPNQNTLFAVGLDETLSVLSLGPNGWTQTQVHQAGEDFDDFAAYRVGVTVTDANGTPVPGAQVTISTDRPVGAWTPDGSLAITPDAPLSAIADYAGRVTFSIPAEELDCAMLSAQALDPSGKPSGQPFPVAPDTDVRAFLGGTGSLHDLGTLTASTLTGATLSGSSTHLFPTLTDASSAAAAVSVFNQLVKTGTDAENHNIAITAAPFQLDLTSGKPKYQSPPPANAAKLQGTHLDVSFSHLFDSIGHAIRHGAMKLATVVVELADDGMSWVVNLAVKIGDDIVNYTNLAISDMKSAFHIIGGFFATLGADIEAAVEWLKHDVLALIAAAKSAAGQLQTWFVKLGGNVTSALDQVEIKTDTFFSDLEGDINNEFKAIWPNIQGTLGDPQQPSGSGSAGSAGNEAGLAHDLGYIGKVINDLPGVWLLHKFESYLPVTDTAPTVDQSIYHPLLAELTTVWSKAMTFSDALYTFAATTMTDAFSTNGHADKTKLSNTQVTAWVEDFQTVLKSALHLLDAIADAVLDVCKIGVALIEAYFTHVYNTVGSLGVLGWILNEVGVDLKFSLSEITSWVVAVPATLVAQCRGYNGLFPSTVSDSHGKAAPHRLGGGRLGTGNDPDGWQVGLGIVGAVAQGIWGFADLIGDLQQFTDPSTGKRGTPSGIIDYFDILCPLVETIALWPSEPNADGTAAYPFHGGIATSTEKFELLPFVVWSAVLPSVMGAVCKAGWTNNLSTSGFPPGVQDAAKDYMQPFVQMIAGMANTALGIAYSAENKAGWVAILGTVLGNLSFIGAPLATKIMADTTGDVSVLVKMAIDAVGNIGAAVCIAEATSLPTP